MKKPIMQIYMGRIVLSVGIKQEGCHDLTKTKGRPVKYSDEKHVEDRYYHLIRDRGIAEMMKKFNVGSILGQAIWAGDKDPLTITEDERQMSLDRDEALKNERAVKKSKAYRDKQEEIKRIASELFT